MDQWGDLSGWREDPPVVPGGTYKVFGGSFRRHHAKAALLTTDGARITYGQLGELTEAVRLGLADGGVAPGDRVLAVVDKSVPALLLYLGCLSRGAVYIPLNPDYTSAEVARVAADARPRLVVCDPRRRRSLSEALPGAKVGVLQPDGQVAVPHPHSRPNPGTPNPTGPSGDDPAVILYTSGTTGSPQGVVLSHRAVLANGLALCRAWEFQAHDILIHALPLFHTHGLLVALHCALLSGATLIFMPRFDPDTAIKLFGKATVFMGVPTYYTRLLDQPGLSPRATGGMRLFTCGSAPLRPRTWEEFQRRSGHGIVERYGLTELGILTSNPVGEPTPGTVGFALEGVLLKVVDSSGNEVAPGTMGELCALTPGALSGFVNQTTESTGIVDARGWVRTGDLASVDQQGRVTLAGRAKDLVITGGLNVHPLEVEITLNAQPQVRESAVFGVPHPDFGEGVVAAVVWSGPKAPGAQSLHRGLSATMAGYKIPKRFLLVDDLPRNAMGKVQKQVLRSQYAELFAR